MTTILDQAQYNNNNNNNNNIYAVEALGEAVDSNFIITPHLVEEWGDEDQEAEWDRLAQEYFDQRDNEEREYYAHWGPNWIEEEEDFNQTREEEWERREEEREKREEERERREEERERREEEREEERIEIENIRQLNNQLRLINIQETELVLLLFTEENSDRRIYLENQLQNLHRIRFQFNRALI